jgi:hypothetical protein
MRHLWLLLLLLSVLVLPGCEAIGDIFQAGMWVGAIVIVFVIAIVAFIASKMRG